MEEHIYRGPREPARVLGHLGLEIERSCYLKSEGRK